MGGPKDCPRCGLVNPPEARRCDCGFDFAAGRFAGSLLPPARAGGFGAGSALALGCLLAAAGVVLGAGVGAAVRVWAAGPGPGGLGMLPLILEGLAGGAVLGGLAGLLLTALIARRCRLPL